ncbi:hypothetical protein RchiOBHm_Chr5g0063571 [Rosa chinensis]|uniref:Uncharacterized protein n=1 Tax=Rosa chinensis TaxID=74649 RepID=A0A2P6QIF2_ROSCH|nr:hypothetical protein RchiOBHm_Chr5g0063571 [Rosa chinensis]
MIHHPPLRYCALLSNIHSKLTSKRTQLSKPGRVQKHLLSPLLEIQKTGNHCQVVRFPSNFFAQIPHIVSQLSLALEVIFFQALAKVYNRGK